MQYMKDDKWVSDGWQCIDHPHPSFMTARSIGFDFTIANMLSYFVHRKASDGNPMNDFKDINTKAFPLFKAKRVEGVVCEHADDCGDVLLKALCAAEMKKSVTYKLRLVLNKGNDVIFATCDCPAGCRPTCVCKHPGAVCYCIEEICRTGIALPYTSCTLTLQQWHKPSRKRKVTPCTLDSVKFVKEEYGKHKRRQLACNNYDPRPSPFISTTSSDVMLMQQQLQQLGTPVARVGAKYIGTCT